MANTMINIFLDTSTYIDSNFLQGKSLQMLFEKAKEGSVKLYSSAIVISEIKSHINDGFKEAKSFYNDLKKNKSARILANTTAYKSTFDAIKDLEYDKESHLLCEKLDELIEEIPITLIPFNTVDIANVFDNYFNEKPPFKKGEKKSEFPDAFILASIVDWCKHEEEKMVIVSKDKDWLNFESNYIKTYDKIEDALTFIHDNQPKNKNYEEVSDYINKLFEKNKSEIIANISVDLSFFGNFDGVGEIKVDGIKINEVKILNYALIGFIGQMSEFYVVIEIDIHANLSHENYDYAIWDKDEDKYVGVQTLRLEVDKKIQTNLLMTAHFNPEIDSFFSVGSITMNNNNPIIIETDPYDDF